MKKRVHILFLALLAAALAALTAAAAGDYTVSVIPAPAGDYAAVADIPVTVGADELFCGWFTTESAAEAESVLAAYLSDPEDPLRQTARPEDFTRGLLTRGVL